MQGFKMEAVTARTNYAGAMKREIERALAQSIVDVERDFKATTRTWRTRVRFTTQRISRRGVAGFTVTTDSKIYLYVDKGTRPHLIRPRRARRLVFSVGGAAKTTPGVIGSSGGRAGGRKVAALVVHHPGTKARNFSVLIARRNQPKFESRMRLAVMNAARSGGKNSR